MKLVHYFDEFMKKTVNINDSRLRDLNDRVDTLYDVLSSDSDIGDIIIGKNPQGSWAHRTIIKPIEGNEFDADFMLVIDEQKGWTPRDYINNVYTSLRETAAYRDKTRKKNRCVRVTYANDCHIDIVPFTVLSDGRQVIMNHETDEWEETGPDEFTAWLKAKNDTAQGNLRRVIRLTKYLRDHHMNFKRTRSVILTIILGERISEIKKIYNPQYYSDLPTAFVHIMEDLNQWMQERPVLPDLPDPSGANNDFSHRWNQESYDNLRNKVKTIAGDARTALDASSIDESLMLWQAVFGNDFKKPSTKSAASAAISGAATGIAPSRTVRAGRAG